MTSCCYHSSNIVTVDLACIAKASGIIKMEKFTLSSTLASWCARVDWCEHLGCFGIPFSLCLCFAQQRQISMYPNHHPKISFALPAL